jgi:transposase-like protein
MKYTKTTNVVNPLNFYYGNISATEYIAISKLANQEKINSFELVIRLMHIELSPDKRYYSIGEIAKAFDVNASLIRFWDKEFDILKPKKNAKGNRMFTPEDVKNLQLIYHLVKERGFTLKVPKRI